MHLLFVACLLLAAGAHAGGGEFEREIKMWTKMKAMESCLGEDLVKMHLIKMKKAAVKCSGQDAPELDLPIFKNPFKLITTLTRPPSPPAGVGKLLSGMLRMQMLQDFVGGESPRIFNKRAADDDVFELGERLQEKLRGQKEKVENKLGNMTCILQECGVFNAQEKFDGELLKRTWKDSGMKIENKWLDEKMTKACDACIAFANSLPEEMLEMSPYGPELCKAKAFKKCMMKSKMYNCMNYDIKQKLEKHFGSVEELTESTGLKEEHLFMVVKQLLKGPEENFA